MAVPHMRIDCDEYVAIIVFRPGVINGEWIHFDNKIRIDLSVSPDNTPGNARHYEEFKPISEIDSFVEWIETSKFYETPDTELGAMFGLTMTDEQAAEFADCLREAKRQWQEREDQHGS